MWLTDELLLYYQRCQRRSFLDVYGDSSQQNPPSDFLLKLQRDSWNYRQTVLADRIYHQPNYPKRDWLSGAQATLELMQQGVDHIYQGVLVASAENSRLPILDFGLESTSENSEFPETNEQFNNLKFEGVTLVGTPHLLVKQPGQSNFGNWTYIPTAIKFGRRPKPEYQTVAAFQALVLASVQGVWPETARLILRPNKVYALDLGKWVPQMQAILAACIQTLLSPQAPEVFISRQRCSFCRWYSHCYALAKSQHHLSLLPGVTPNRYQYLQSIGLSAVESLASTHPSQLEPVFGYEVATALVRQAQSVVQNRAILIPKEGNNPSIQPPLSPRQKETAEEEILFTQSISINVSSVSEMAPEELAVPESARKNHSVQGEVIHPSGNTNTLPTAPIELYFDIEAEPDLNLDYLLGVLVVDRLAETQTFHPLLAEQPAAEEFIWQQFLDLVWTYPDAPIFHFSPYESDTIKRLSKLYKTPPSRVKPVLSRFVDVHNRVMGAVTLPVESYSLKSIATWLGFEWRDPLSSGSQSIFWYDQWLKTSDHNCLEAIVRYNEDDCCATYHVKDWLVNFLQDFDPAEQPNIITAL